jgi:DNA-3-methyladenine glycosylase II
MRRAVNHLKKSDPVLRAIIERVGPCRMQFRPPEFHSLARSIVYQQLNGKAAAKIFDRFAALAGEPITPRGILKLSDEQLRSVGLSKQKAGYLKDLAAKTAAGELDFPRLAQLPDAEVIEHLTQVKGVGVWTAQMFLMFTLYLDVQRAKAAKKSTAKKKSSAGAKKSKSKIKLPTPEQMEKIAKCWEPYRSVACWYLWRSIDTKTP